MQLLELTVALVFGFARAGLIAQFPSSGLLLLLQAPSTVFSWRLSVPYCLVLWHSSVLPDTLLILCPVCQSDAHPLLVPAENGTHPCL